MSNWQNPNFNLNAPEFVPKFGAPGPQQGNPNQPPRIPGMMPPNQQMPPNMGMGYQQPHPYYQMPPQYHQQQQHQYRPNMHHQPQNQQIYYQQQQQQHHHQPHFNNVQTSPTNQNNQHQQPQHKNNASPQNNINQQQPQQSQPQPQPQPQQQQNKNTSDKEVNQLASNLSKLSTEKESVQQPPKQAAQQPAKEVPKPVVETNNKPSTDTANNTVEPSVSIEKSIAPSVDAIKEDEEWEDNQMDGDESANDKAEGGELSGKPKKSIVIREYKPKKEPVNVIFCGHVDAGKSTIGGQIMFLTGMVDKRTLEKYEREAKEKNRESWYLSWALDTNLEEREKGKTVEVGRAFFETEKKHFIILDAPGHRGFVPNMIGGASQADIAVLVISARRGEFETGFERGGQTREHAMLVKTAGVKYLVVLVNKMDDSTVNWDQARYDDIKDKLTPYLKKCGFQPGKDCFFMPCSGFTGAFIKDPVEESICPWYRGPCFIEYLENMPTINRTVSGAVRMPIIDKYKDMGTVVMGKIESGTIKLNDKFVVMPNKVKVEVVNIYCEEDETDSAICGENVKLKLKGIEEEEISSGFVLCDSKDLCHVAKVFDAQVVILECPSIICPGFNSILHIHSSTVEVQLQRIIGMVDKKTGEKDLKNRPRFIKQDQISICRFEVLGGNIICMEPFKLFPQLGRFTLRYENKTIAVGKVLKIIE